MSVNTLSHHRYTIKERELKMKKILLIITVSFVFVLCACTASLAKVNKEERAVEANAMINIEDYLTNVEEGTEVTYVIDEEKSEVVFTLTNGDKTQTLTKKVTILEPLGVFNEKTAINLYDGYVIEELLTLNDGVTIEEHTLDEETGLLKATLTNGERESTIFTVAEIIKPMGSWISESINIDTYIGYDLSDFMEYEKDAEYEAVLDRDKGTINVTLTKGNRVETYTHSAVITNSSPNPMAVYGYFPVVFHSTWMICDHWPTSLEFICDMTFYEDYTFYRHSTYSGMTFTGTYTDDGQLIYNEFSDPRPYDYRLEGDELIVHWADKTNQTEHYQREISD